MKKSLLLFKNAFKQAFRNKIQLVGLIILVLLSSTIFSLMQTSLSRVANEYQTLVIKSNLHDFVIDLSNTADIKTTPSSTADPLLTQQKNINNIANNVNNKFIWERVEARTMQLNNNNNPRLLKILTNNKRAHIDKLVINEGYNIGDRNNPDQITPISQQVVINKEFAHNNNLAIGDTIRLQLDDLGSSLKVSNYNLNDPIYSTYNWFKIVGYGVSADFTTPIVDQTTPIPNKIREGVIYVDPSQFGLTIGSKTENNYEWTYQPRDEKLTVSSNSDREIYYVGKWVLGTNNDISKVVDELKDKYISTIDASAKLAYAIGDSNYIFNNRTSTITATITGFKTLLIALLLIVLIITGITVVLITAKNIDNSRTQIGILKSLGYSNSKILITSLAYPMIAALLGTILVFLPASGLQLIVVHTFANYFNLNFGTFTFNGLGFLYCLILTFGFLSIIAWVISALTVIKKPIALIKNDSATVNSRFSRMVKKTSINRPFLTRFRLSLFTSSIGKMAAASLTMFLGTTLMTAAIMGPKIMSDNKLVSFTGMNYKSMVEYQMPTYNSPFTMYKTYNPSLLASDWDYETITDESSGTTYNRPNRRNNGKYIQELINNSINSEAYAPMSWNDNPSAAIINLGLFGLTFLNGKMLTKPFLNGLDKSNFNDSIAGIIASIAWRGVVPIYKIINDSSDSETFYKINSFNILKLFYRNYRTTVAMSINDIFKENGQWSKSKFDTYAQANLPIYSYSPPNGAGNTFKQEIDKSDNLFVNTNDHKIQLQNENELLNNSAEKLGQSKTNNWINKISLWFSALFYDRVGQTVLQGVYSRSPYFIRQNIANAYNDEKSPFNVSFNVIPFNKDTDELGTYFTGTPNKKFKGRNYPIKVYGLQDAKQLHGKLSKMQLYDSNGIALNPLLAKANNNPNIINIVINQTIAKQLNLKENDSFTMNSDGNVMKYKKDGKYLDFKTDQVDFTEINSKDNGALIDNNVTLLKQKTIFKDFNNNSVYENVGSNATEMLKNVIKGHVINQRDTEIKKYQVIGVYNGYGQPNAYISKHDADKILHFDQTREMLFRIFQQEWQGKPPKTVAGYNFEFNKLTKKDLTLTTFENDKSNAELVKMFDHENPIFNFKMSSSNSLPDIETSFSTSQIYGDYSAFGLNGSTDKDDNVKGYGVGSADNISPLAVHHLLLNQITALVDAILVAFITFSLIISFFIILLTSNLVIYENRKTIATMKTLGYSDAKITNIVIGMYLPVIIAMFIMGFPIGFFIVKLIVNYLAYNTTWVLPLIFNWWLLIVVAIVVLGIYALTFIIDWYAMKKINPIKMLNEID